MIMKDVSVLLFVSQNCAYLPKFYWHCYYIFQQYWQLQCCWAYTNYIVSTKLEQRLTLFWKNNKNGI